MKAKIVKIHKNYLEFDTGHTLHSFHEQDCCEIHYVDFDYMKLEDVQDLVFDISSSNFIEPVAKYGVRLAPTNNFPVSVPGYGENNGYYSTHLALILRDAEGKEIWNLNISECQSIEYGW
jgi:hypothetical protein